MAAPKALISAGKALKNEFSQTPIRSTAALSTSGFVGGAAVATAMSKKNVQDHDPSIGVNSARHPFPSY